MTDEHPEETEIEDPSRVVEGFLSALHEEDWDAATLAIDENIVCDNVGYPIINGRRGVMKFWRRIFDRPSGGFEAKIHRVAVEGVSVLTERTDVMVFGPFRFQIWVCGVFEVRNGKITLWRNYFDVLDMLKAALRGVVGMVMPSLKPTLL
jgi:limonene-1,2-epoxide hydrolase